MINTEHKLIALLKSNEMSIATCESCTGGLISKRITDVSGSSEVFGFGLCTYANEAKIKLLNVKSDTLKNYGAVSEKTAGEMAYGLLELSGANIAISTTGIAGPGGGTEQKPVGLVYTAIATSDGFFKCKKLLLWNIENPTRENIRIAASEEAMQLAIEYLEQNYAKK